MRDNNNQNLEDRGWESMSAILDKELPIKRKNRRFFLFYWWGGVAAVLIAAFMIINWNSEITHNEETLSDHNELTFDQTKIRIGEKNHSDDAEVLQSQNILKNNDINIENKNYDLSELNNSQSLNEKPKQISTISKVIAEDDKIKPEINPSELAISYDSKTNHIYENKPGKNTLEDQKTHITDSKEIISLMQVPGIFCCTELNHARETKNLLLTKTDKRNKSEVYIVGESLVAGLKPAVGFNLGIGYSKPITNRIGIDFGMNLTSAYYPLNGGVDFVNGLTDLETSDPATNFDPGSQPVEDQMDLGSFLNDGGRVLSNSYSSILTSMEELHFINVPFGISYQATFKSQLMASVHYSYLLNSKISTIDAKGTSVQFSNEQSRSFFNQHQIGIGFTYKYKLNRLLSLNMRSQFNVSPLLKSELPYLEGMRFNTLNLGIRYQIL